MVCLAVWVCVQWVEGDCVHHCLVAQLPSLPDTVDRRVGWVSGTDANDVVGVGWSYVPFVVSGGGAPSPRYLHILWREFRPCGVSAQALCCDCGRASSNEWVINCVPWV